jgi:hypothetical protein
MASPRMRTCAARAAVARSAASRWFGLGPPRLDVPRQRGARAKPGSWRCSQRASARARREQGHARRTLRGLRRGRRSASRSERSPSAHSCAARTSAPGMRVARVLVRQRGVRHAELGNAFSSSPSWPVSLGHRCSPGIAKCCSSPDRLPGIAGRGLARRVQGLALQASCGRDPADRGRRRTFAALSPGALACSCTDISRASPARLATSCAAPNAWCTRAWRSAFRCARRASR